MASEYATPAVHELARPPNIHTGAPGSRRNTATTSSGQQSRPASDPFTTGSGNRDQPRRESPRSDRNRENLARPVLSHSPASDIVRYGDHPEGTWRHSPPEIRMESPGQDTRRRSPSPPLPPVPPGPGVRLTDTQFDYALPRRRATVSIMDPTIQPTGAPLSRHATRHSSRGQVFDDRGEKFYNGNHGEVLKGSIKDRLSKTIQSAEVERNKYATRASTTGLALNIAIGLQVLLGSLTTGLSAVAVRGRSAAVATTILGALATLVASYLARARGSNEPELSITRTKDLEHFLRECNNFSDDHGHVVGHEYDDQLEEFRRRFEELLGNANGERKLSPPGA